MKYDMGKSVAQRKAFGQTLVELGKTNDKLVVLDPDVCASTQTHLFRDAYPNRFFQIGIAEQNMLGIAAGISSLGLIPFVSGFAVFIAHRSGDQIRNSIAHTRANVKINGGYGGLPTGRAGATHSAFEDLAIMRSLPNMTIFEPADATEADLFTRMAVEMDGPVYLRTVRCEVPTIFDENHKVVLGKAVSLKQGSDLAIISTGMMTARAIEACSALEKEGIHARLIHMPTIKPIDREAIAEAAESCGKIMTIENHSVIGGLGSAVCEVTSEECPCRVARLGFQDIFLESGDDSVLFDRYGLSTEKIINKAKAFLG